ncbi:hypothetical protein CR513_05124, partial [Mucuna pruriens]
MDYYLKHPNSKVRNELLSHSSKRSIKFFLKPFLMQFFSYTYIIEKSYMFLLCNGLLILIAMNSGLIDVSSPSTTHQSMARAVHMETSIRSESKEPDIAAEETASPQEQEEEEESIVIVEQESVLSVSDTQEEEENALAIIDEDEDDTEELNKKCEDFIKKMKATFSFNNLDNQKLLVLAVD